jgi:hypothetical protein
MKNPIHKTLLGIGLLALATTYASAQSTNKTKIPALPVGNMSAYPTVVKTGTKPTLTWAILYPSSIQNAASITPPGMMTMSESLYLTVRPVGSKLQNDKGQDLPLEARISINGSNYQQLFYGTNTDINVTQALFVKQVGKNTTINFGGRFVEDGQWSPFHTTRSSTAQVVTLIDGDKIPTSFNIDSDEHPKLASHLRPYVDGGGKVKVGPMSALVLFELDQTNRSQTNFDYQDMALLLTFNSKNNGHGNNLDGVDASNPGGGKGGPTGTTDPSGDVDDER